MQAQQIEVESSFGVLLGESQELVYAYSGSTDILSRLDWEMMPLTYYGSTLMLKPADAAASGYVVNLGIKFGFPGNTGTIEDRDWRGTSDALTHFSAHDCFTEQALLVDAALGYRLSLPYNLALTPLVKFSTMRFRWTARDGYTQYGPNINEPYVEWDSSFAKESIYGTGIAYEQNWILILSGLQLDWQVGRRGTLASGILISALLYCADQDDHILRLLQFNETMSGGFAYEPHFSFSYAFSGRTTFSAKTSHRNIQGLRGDTAIMKIGTGTDQGTDEDSAGVSYSVFDFTLSARISL